MAIVADKSGNTPTDKPHDSPNRKIAGSPVGVTTPQYSGEIVLDTTTGSTWYATDLTTTGWVSASLDA
jgi:hypothetical protein